MTFIHELPRWPELVWDMNALGHKLAHLRHKQGHLLGRMEALGFDLRDEANVVVLTREVVETSAIEGEHLDTSEVRSSIARKLGLEVAGLSTTFNGRVEGIVEIMLDATLHANEPLTKERLWGWHAALFPTGFSGMRRISVGSWRSSEAGAMQVVSGAIGHERLHFEAPNADRLPHEMEQFLNWFGRVINSPFELDPVLVAGVAHFWFVTIHPFEDGNGRIARAIADMALTRSDNISQRFYSLSSQIMAERKDYYRELEQAQRGSLDVTSWLDWFLGCLDRAILRADEMIAAVLHRAKVWQRANAHPGLNSRQRIVLQRLLNDFKGHLTTSKYATFAKCSNDSALRDIEALVEAGVLMRNTGGGRSTSYRLREKSPIQ